MLQWHWLYYTKGSRDAHNPTIVMLVLQLTAAALSTTFLAFTPLGILGITHSKRGKIVYGLHNLSWRVAWRCTMCGFGSYNLRGSLLIARSNTIQRHGLLPKLGPLNNYLILLVAEELWTWFNLAIHLTGHIWCYFMPVNSTSSFY